jgi:hypothetical protein
MSKRNSINLALGVVFLAGTLTACGSGSGSGSGSDGSPTTVSFGVTDAPVDSAEAVVVTFSGIDLLDDSGTRVGGFELESNRQVDLLQLQGANSEFLVTGASIEPGVYNEIRLIAVAEQPSCNNLVAPFDSYITVDGTEYPLVVPSGAQTGLKVKGPITIAAGERASFVIDFDLRKAVSERGNKGCYNLSPVLRIVDTAEVGTLSGTVDKQLLTSSACTANTETGSGAAIYLYDRSDGSDVTPDDVGSAGEPFASSNLLAASDGSGDFTYEIGFLLAGNYTAALTCQAGDDLPESDDNIEFLEAKNVGITADGLTEEDFVFTPPPEPPAPAPPETEG